MIDEHGFRANVGIVLMNDAGRVFCGRRAGMSAWQFPQGGIQEYETPEKAMYRELEEEVGLTSGDVELLASTKRWLRYRLPKRYIRYHQRPVCIGQKQIWFLLRLAAKESAVRLDASDEQEFDAWRWVDYWEPLGFVVSFKRNVYRRALNEFAEQIGEAFGIPAPAGGGLAPVPPEQGR